MSDIYPITGRPFVHAYPITYRQITTGLWYMNSIGQAPAWPPESQAGWSWLSDGSDHPAKQMFMWYADDLSGTGFVPGNAGPQGPGNPFAYYDHRWFGIQMFSDWTEGTAWNDYLYSVGWLHYDIPPDVAARIERADLVINLDANAEQFDDNLPFIVQVRNNPLRDYFGYTPSWEDFATITGPSICPVVTNQEVWEHSHSAEPHRYSDPYIPEAHFGGHYGPRHVLPINAAGLAQIRRGGRVGIYCGLAGDTPPSGWNFVFAECDYSYWDSELPLTGPNNAGAYLPHLRLWLGGGEADMTLGLHIEARPRIDDPKRILSHAARRRRGW